MCRCWTDAAGYVSVGGVAYPTPRLQGEEELKAGIDLGELTNHGEGREDEEDDSVGDREGRGEGKDMKQCHSYTQNRLFLGQTSEHMPLFYYKPAPSLEQSWYQSSAPTLSAPLRGRAARVGAR